MRRLDLKEARNKFGLIGALEDKTSQLKRQKKSSNEKCLCGLSFLHDPRRNEDWAKKIRELINCREDL